MPQWALLKLLVNHMIAKRLEKESRILALENDAIRGLLSTPAPWSVP